MYGLSVRRVQQLVKYYKDSGKTPELKKERRSRTYLSEEQKAAIDKAFEETKFRQIPRPKSRNAL